MFLIILGLAVFFAASSLRKLQSPFPHYAGIVRIAASVMIVLGILTSCITQIDAGEIGVQTLFGQVQNNVLKSGLHFINPLMQINRIDVRTQNYTMSGVRNE